MNSIIEKKYFKGEKGLYFFRGLGKSDPYNTFFLTYILNKVDWGPFPKKLKAHIFGRIKSQKKVKVSFINLKNLSRNWGQFSSNEQYLA